MRRWRKNNISILNMTSTRNNNTPGNYKMQTAINSHLFKSSMYKHGSFGTPYLSSIPDGGSAPPSRMDRNRLSKNPIEIESQLFGIGSSNLVKGYTPPLATIHHLKDISFFDRNKIIMPCALMVEGAQRALPL
jgi:hypothetical protein